MNHIEEIGRYLTDQYLGGRRHRLKSMALIKANPYIIEDLTGYLESASELILSKVNWDGTRYCTKMTSLSIEIGKEVLSRTGLVYQENVEDFIHVGDLFLEGFFQCGYIVIEPPLRGTRDATQIVLSEHWPTEVHQLEGATAVKAVWTECPNDLSGPIQYCKTGEGPMMAHRVIKSIDKEDALAATADLDKPVFRAINKLQQVPWQIDERILEAAISNPLAFYNPAKGDKTNESKRMAYNYTIAKASKLVDEDALYFVVDADFRGRLYYKESYIDYQGSDLSKGLLRFAEAKEMTDMGFRWLQIHAACSFNQSFKIDDPILQEYEADYITFLQEEELKSISVDKMTLTDRAAWTENNLYFVLETAEKRLIHKDCEKPVAFLAACLEIRDCLQAWFKGETFYSALPIPIDGSNNGWQHLAAISKDYRAGKLVGLVPLEIQQDFYVACAKRLKGMTTDPELVAILEEMPMKDIRKGIAKRGSMTKAYSAGAEKIGKNMWDDVKKEGFHKKYGINADHCMKFAAILVKAIKEVCPGPLDTMKYLQKSAAAALDSTDTHRITWTSPSGFQVFYTAPYYNDLTFQVPILGLQRSRGRVGHVVRLRAEGTKDLRAYASGISPNFIHSQDASHMALTIDEFEGSFAAVHDSFATHACDVDELLDITKEVFINMYAFDNYFDEIDKIFGTSVDQPSLGFLKVNKIHHSDYFFA